jgi:hypothetical protein
MIWVSHLLWPNPIFLHRYSVAEACSWLLDHSKICSARDHKICWDMVPRARGTMRNCNPGCWCLHCTVVKGEEFSLRQCKMQELPGMWTYLAAFPTYKYELSSIDIVQFGDHYRVFA